MKFGTTTFTNEVIGNFEGSLDKKPSEFESLKPTHQMIKEAPNTN